MHRAVLIAAMVAALVSTVPAAAAAQSPTPAATAPQGPAPTEGTPYDAYLTKVIAATGSFPDDGKDWNDETLGATALVFREGQLFTFPDPCYYDLYVGQWRVYAAILDVTDASRRERTRATDRLTARLDEVPDLLTAATEACIGPDSDG
jgi:hypothetical protein